MAEEHVGENSHIWSQEVGGRRREGVETHAFEGALLRAAHKAIPLKGSTIYQQCCLEAKSFMSGLLVDVRHPKYSIFPIKFN
jgi:hypothetical protein